MSDFTSNFWSVFVTALTLVGIIGCAVLLWMAGRKKVVATSDNTTGHVWDEDLTEMNNPLPRWWMWLFVITVVFSAVYLAFYPAFVVGIVPRYETSVQPPCSGPGALLNRQYTRM